ncbi:MAG: ATP-NAD kinase family protein [Methanoregula sp.]|nr:ATP-NAD kinase family protein [Methanoregula sp.]
MKRIGFLINPIAGMGGAVGLKGTDGNIEVAISRGAAPGAKNRAKITLQNLKNNQDLIFLTPSGAMGEDALRETGVQNVEVVSQVGNHSSADDTKIAVQKFIEQGVDLILFCGGDGTARDILDVVGRNVPILGIPAGVKMYSAVFAIDPAAAAEVVMTPGETSLRDSEVMDVDEDAYRAGELKTRLYGFARVPSVHGKTQTSKQVFEERNEERAKTEIARFFHEIMIPDILYILGAGTTTESIARELGLNKTLLGVDAIKNGKIVSMDMDEKTLWDLIESGQETKIILSPIGAMGFILGRGNQQISARIVKRIGIKNIIVVASPHKLRETPILYVDSGDAALDSEFGDSVLVISGYHIAQRKPLYQPHRG